MRSLANFLSPREAAFPVHGAEFLCPGKGMPPEPFALGTRLFSSLSVELERILGLRVAAPSGVQGVEKHVLLSVCLCTCVCCCYGFSGEND